MKCPAEVYTSSRRPYQGLPDLDYAFHDRDVIVTACGRICIYRKKINVSTVLAGQRLRIKEAHSCCRRHRVRRWQMADPIPTALIHKRAGGLCAAQGANTKAMI